MNIRSRGENGAEVLNEETPFLIPTKNTSLAELHISQLHTFCVEGHSCLTLGRGC